MPRELLNIDYMLHVVLSFLKTISPHPFLLTYSKLIILFQLNVRLKIHKKSNRTTKRVTDSINILIAYRVAYIS